MGRNIHRTVHLATARFTGTKTHAMYHHKYDELMSPLWSDLLKLFWSSTVKHSETQSFLILNLQPSFSPLLFTPDLLKSLFFLFQIINVTLHPWLVGGVGDTQCLSSLCNKRSGADFASFPSTLNGVAYKDVERQTLLTDLQTAVHHNLSCREINKLIMESSTWRMRG